MRGGLSLITGALCVASAAAGAGFELKHSGAECASSDVNLHDQETVQACADACQANTVCRFFIFGTGRKAKRCWAELTTTDDCPEGWESDEYDFYALTVPRAAYPAPKPPPPAPLPSSPPPLIHPPPSSPHPIWHRERYGAECASPDSTLGQQPTLEACAQRCQQTPGCLYFIYGRGFKAGRCYWEHTETADCTEGWEVDEYDFFSTWCTGSGEGCHRGCTEPRASNFDSTANVDDGSCISQSGCVEEPCTKCDIDPKTGTCASDMPYRSYEYDQIEASHIDDGEIVVDGDLSDWGVHMQDRCYKDVPFAKMDNTEVVFETAVADRKHGAGKYFGESDFSIRWMVSWDSTYLYLAAKVTDDVLQTSNVCYQNGLQVAFEVGGPGQGEKKGMLQAERSSDLDVSRLELINMALGADQSACSTEGTDSMLCCVQYELSQQEGGFFRRSKVAVLRNPMARTTTYEAAFHKTDLVGATPHHKQQWAEGLTFGFSFAINDGDDVATQNGWAGYYPHALVQGWNGGQKEPHKAGTMRLAGRNAGCSGSHCGSAGSHAEAGHATGGGGGMLWLGAFIALLSISLSRAISTCRASSLGSAFDLINPVGAGAGLFLGLLLGLGVANGRGGFGMFLLGVLLGLLSVFLYHATVAWRSGGMSAVKLMFLNPFGERARPEPTMTNSSLSATPGAGYSSYTPPA